MSEGLPPPKPGAAPVAPPVLGPELCKEAAAALRDHQSVLKIHGNPIAPLDLERMAQGGSQDRKDDLARLTSNQLTDVGVFARLLRAMIDGIKAGKHPKGAAIEVGKAATPMSKTQAVTGALQRTGPATASGLRAGAVGAALRQSAGMGPDKLFVELLSKALLPFKGADDRASLVNLQQISAQAFDTQIVLLERVLAKLDAVMVQRLCRDVLRTSPATRSLGMDALRLLSPIADAMEAAVAVRALTQAYLVMRENAAAIVGLAEVHRGAIAAHMKGRDVVNEVLSLQKAPSTVPPLCDRQLGTALVLSERLALASAASAELEPSGLLGQVYRRVAFDVTSGAAAQALAAFVRLTEALAAANVELPEALREQPVKTESADKVSDKPAAKRAPQWPPLKPEDIAALGDHVFSALPERASDLLPSAGLPPQRSAARLLLTLRGEQALVPSWLAIMDAGLRPGSTCSEAGRAKLKASRDFFSVLDAAARDEIVRGLYQMGSGDPEQRARQVGRYLVTEAPDALKDGATLGPIRVAFAKYWRRMESGG